MRWKIDSWPNSREVWRSQLFSQFINKKYISWEKSIPILSSVIFYHSDSVEFQKTLVNVNIFLQSSCKNLFKSIENWREMRKRRFLKCKKCSPGASKHKEIQKKTISFDHFWTFRKKTKKTITLILSLFLLSWGQVLFVIAKKYAFFIFLFCQASRSCQITSMSRKID